MSIFKVLKKLFLERRKKQIEIRQIPESSVGPVRSLARAPPTPPPRARKVRVRHKRNGAARPAAHGLEGIWKFRTGLAH